MAVIDKVTVTGTNQDADVKITLDGETINLPSGAATAANQSTIIGHVDGIETLLGTIDADTSLMSSNLSTIAGAISGTEMQVDVVTLPSLPAGTNNIGDVDILTVPAPLNVTGGGTEASALRVTLASDSTGLISIDDNGGSITVDNNGTFAVQASQAGTWNIGTVTTVTTLTSITNAVTVVGGVAHDAADSGNPIKIGGKAVATPSTATMVAAADRSDITVDLDGALLVRSDNTLGDLISERVSDTTGTSTAFTNFGATASTRNYIRAISVYNTSASAGYVDFRDGTGGTILWTMALPAGGGAIINADSPIFRTSANTALAYDVSAALTTVYISVSGFKSKV